MLTREETIKAFECCYMTHNCGECPFDELGEWECSIGEPEINRAVMHYLKENEPAPAATGTSSEVSVKEDTDNIHLNDSTLLDICQEELEAISEISLNDYPNEYLTGYIVALKKNIERLRGGEGNG